MSLKTYSKAPIVIHSEPIVKEEMIIEPTNTPKRHISVWEFITNSYNEALDYLTISKVTGLILPISLILIGLIILFNQIWPEIVQQIREHENYYDKGTTPLVAGDYIEDRQIYLSNPGSEYFQNLTDSAFNEKILQDDPISKNYNGYFNLSIPSLELYDLSVKANVNSNSEDDYEKILQSHLAHFSGTGLPISNVKNNIVIYGHSGRGDYFERTKDPVGAFSQLQKINIGDEIIIKIEGNSYKYKVTKTKIVQPNDLSIINGDGNKQTLTLFTCFPNGNPSKRFVVVGRPV